VTGRLLLALALAGCARRSPPRSLRSATRAPEAVAPAPTAVLWSTLAPGLSWTQVDPQFDEAPARLIWTVLRIDLARWSLRAERSRDDTLAGLANDPAVATAINAGFFEADHGASGIVLSQGVTLGRYAPRGGTGVLTVRDGRASVEAAAGFPEDFGGELAVQCGPRLVEEGGLVGVYRDDGRRAARTAACVRDGGRTLDLVLTWDVDAPLRGPGLQWFARRLAGPSPTGDRVGCERALNLDGGPSTGFHLAGGRGHDALGPTPWLLTARAR
jgi:hypothetical protein